MQYLLLRITSFVSHSKLDDVDPLPKLSCTARALRDVYCGARETVGGSSVSSGCWGEDSNHEYGWARRTPTSCRAHSLFKPTIFLVNSLHAKSNRAYVLESTRLVNELVVSRTISLFQCTGSPISLNGSKRTSCITIDQVSAKTWTS